MPLQIVAPMVLAALAKRRTQRTKSVGVPDLTDLLTREVGAVQENPAASDFLTSLLDSNGDGSMLDDVARKGLGILRGMMADRAGGSRFN